MKLLGNFRSVVLRSLGFTSGTRSVFMRLVALSTQDSIQRRVQASDTPRLVDRHSGVFATLSNKSVHATIKVAELKLALRQELSDSVIMPVATLTWPLNED
jgi:hypothetical protein